MPETPTTPPLDALRELCLADDAPVFDTALAQRAALRLAQLATSVLDDVTRGELVAAQRTTTTASFFALWQSERELLDDVAGLVQYLHRTT